MTPSRLTLAVVLAASLVAGRAHAERPAGGEPCALMEHLPSAKDPVRAVKPFRAGFRILDAAGSDPRRIGQAHDTLAAALGRLLAESRRLFHPAAGRTVDPNKAQRFLRQWVLGPDAVLRVADEQLEPVLALQATLAWTACRSGRPDLALRWARRPLATGEVGGLVPFAALLLLDAGRVEEARELLPALGDEGFLAPWVEAELTPDPQRRMAARATAGRRLTTPAQGAAFAAQGQRLAPR